MSNHERNITRSQKPRKNNFFFKPKKSVLIICLLLITTCLYQIKPVVSSTIRHVPTEYTTIQAAVNAATAGDTIQVDPKPNNEPYYEHIYVNKTLTILGNPTDPTTIIINGTANGSVFDLEASNVEISGFTLCNAGNENDSIVMERDSVTQKDDYNKIYNNIITTSHYGVYISYSHHNTIQNNTFISNPFAGIYLANANYTQILENNIKESIYGIKTSGARNNFITDNKISQTAYGIYLSLSSTSNTIRRNVLSGQTSGIYSSSDSTIIDHNTINYGAYGIYFASCKTGTIKYNTIINSSSGIRLYTTTGAHNVSNNRIVNTYWAIELVSSNSHTFAGNWLQQNTYGMYLEGSTACTIYRNNFLYNNKSAYSALTNTWDKNNEGNYWSDYSGTGTYKIRPSGTDNHPLKYTWSEHDIAILSVTPSANEVNQGAIVDITVVSKNRANITVSETFTVTTKYNSTIIGTKTVYNLAKGATNSSTFHWNTAGVAPGNYIISAEASIVPDELNTDNNNKTDGTVKIKPLGYDVTINAYCNSESASVSVSITMDGTPTGYNTPQTFTVTSGSHTFTVPGADANEHPFKQWSTGATTPTISVNSAGTYTAYYEAVHDVAVLSVTASPNTVVQGQTVTISVEVKNEGNVIETFNVTAYHNDTAVGPAQTVTALSPGSSTILTFTWDTSADYGNYTVSATANLIPPEVDIDPSDNTSIDGMVQVKERLIGDVNGDGAVNSTDLVLLNQAFGSTSTSGSNWNPNADLNKDNIIDIQDLLLLGNNYGKTY